MRTRIRRAAVTTSGAVLVLASLAGCGSDSTTPGARAAQSATSVSGVPARPLSQAELWNAVITAEDVPGFEVDYVQSRNAPFRPGIPANRLPAVFPAACAPAYWSTQAASAYPAGARIDAMAHTTGTPEQFGNVVLTDYSATGASAAMADLRTSLKACAGAHIERHDPLAGGISFTRPTLRPGPRLGDDALTYRITQNVAGDDLDPEPLEVPMTFTVVRTGTTVVTFWNQGDATSATPAVIAPPLIPAQITKLTRFAKARHSTV
ncbi:hypothetical protein [Actinacidiphila paucisporea]|uniref:PknH-like extracellular domain-containing protein n=1 Tax=Actinacidiphila paucisporea TaxID=310782 RepID=A0A1M7N0P7_9ACTN|nr:hypothetical protein [Actinacidiphila paucisporea]SHM96904.1 hypothetical protein SAMN05216499_11775 [Actinacidiphila paucisporea]